MTRFQRKIYTLTFVAIFFILAPSLIFFAKGYRFDRIGKVFVHSGSIIIKSYPKKVDIYVDGKKIDNKRLNFINNYYIVNGIRPGKHTVTCKKSGYTSWQKNIEVHSGLSTEFWNVLLMPEPNKSLKSFSVKDVKRFYLSPRQKYELVLYQKTNSLKNISIFNAKNEENTILYSDKDRYDKLIPDQEENIEWSSNHKKILIPAEESGEKDYIIINAKKNEDDTYLSLNDVFKKTKFQLTTTPVQSVDSSETQNIDNDDLNTETETINHQSISAKEKTLPSPNARIHLARWIFGSDYKILLLTEEHNLYIINIKDPKKSISVDNNVTGFDLAGDHIYYLKSTDNFVWDIKINQPQNKKPINTVNFQENVTDFVKMIAYDEYRIAFITPNKKLYILNNDKEEDEIFFGNISNDIEGVQFSDDGKKLLYWSNNEIYVYMLRAWKVQPKRAKGDKIFITRFATETNNVQWMHNFENILFTNNNLVKVSEIDNRSNINLINIFQANNTCAEYSYIYDKDSYVLYFLDTAKDNPSEINLYSLTLLENTNFLNFGN